MKKIPEETGLTDSAAVTDTTSGNVRLIWCDDGYLIDYDSIGCNITHILFDFSSTFRTKLYIII